MATIHKAVEPVTSRPPGCSEELYPFEHRLRQVLFSNPRRVVNYLIEYFTQLLPIPPMLVPYLHRMRGVRFIDAKTVYIGPSVWIETLYPEDITIGRNVIIAAGAKILAHFYDPSVRGHFHRRGKVVIEDDVFIGMNSMIAAPVTIGQGAVVGAGAVVTCDVPPHTVAAGIPAKIVHERDYVRTTDTTEVPKIVDSTV